MRLWLPTLLLLLGSLASEAQEPMFTVLVPDNDVLTAKAKVGETAKRLIIVARLSPNLTRLKLSRPDAPFSIEQETIEFEKDRDTAKIEVTFAPTRKGRFLDTITISDGFHRADVLLIGETERDDQRWTLLNDSLDFGIMEPDQSREARFGLQNNSNEPITLKWDRPIPVYTTHRPGQDPITPVLEAKIDPGQTIYVLTIAHGDKARPGPNTDTLRISDGQPYNNRGESVQHLVLKAYLGDTSGNRPGRLVFIPRALEFPQQPSTGTNTTRRALLMYAGRGYARVGKFAVQGMSASHFTFVTSPLPKDLYPGDSVVVDVTYDHEANPFARALLTVKGEIFDGNERFEAAGLILFSGDTTTVRQLDITMATNDAYSGSISRATFTTTATIPSDVHHGIVTVTYNATVLAPNTFQLDPEDPVNEGSRTSRFRLDVTERNEGSLIGVVEFRTALGNSASTPLDVVGFDWFDANDTPIEINTTINSTVITVLDAKGNEVNVDVGPLSLSVTPSPVQDNATVTFERGELPSTLKLYDQMGSLVMDYSSLLQGASGSFSISGSTLPSGVYLFHLTGGRYSYVIRMIVE